MFQRFSSILFGDAPEEASGSAVHVGFGKNGEDEEDWIFVNYLAKACSSTQELLEVCSESSDAPDCPLRYTSCSSLDSAVDGELEDGGFLHVEEEEEEEEEECDLEESWFITPPPCFTAGGKAPILLETSPLENLLIEHPSMSVYAVHSPHHHNFQRHLKEHPSEPSTLRTELQHRPSNTSEFYATTLSVTHPNFLEEANGSQPARKVRDRQQQLTRKGLRRLNLLRDGGARQAKATAGHVHQPGQRQYNY